MYCFSGPISTHAPAPSRLPISAIRVSVLSRRLEPSEGFSGLPLAPLRGYCVQKSSNRDSVESSLGDSPESTGLTFIGYWFMVIGYWFMVGGASHTLVHACSLFFSFPFSVAIRLFVSAFRRYKSSSSLMRCWTYLTHFGDQNRS